MPSRIVILLPVAASLLLTACGSSSSSSSTSAASGTALTPGCSTVRHDYPTMAGKTFVIATDPSSPGYETINPASSAPGHVVGFDASLMAALSSCLGFRYNYLTESFGSLIPSLQAGRAQIVISTLYATPARAQVVNFIAYENVVDGTLVRKGNPQHFTSLQATCGATFAQETGAVESQVVQQQNAVCKREGKKPNSILLYANQDEVFTAVEDGRAEITMTDVPVITKIAQQFSSSVQSGFDTRLPYTIAMAFQKAETQPLHAFNAALLAIQKNGLETKLLEQWTLAPQSLAPAKMITG